MNKYHVYYTTKLSLLDELNQRSTKMKRYTLNGITFRYFPQKVLTFVKNPKCVACGIEATEVRIERSFSSDPVYGKPHLNVYAVCGLYEVLMTVDHNHLASKGGPDLETNFNTMCSKCNQLRSNKTETVDEFLEKVKGRNLLQEHMNNFFNVQKKKNNIDKSKLLEERRLRQELWETDHLWHVREFGRHMKALKKEQKKLNKHD
ncbi:HNH endonuclease [Escherichia coli]|uniref:HNH endonuclease n=1 Tax=Escherichia coli TaxID=562 RepID=UPI0021CED817|nr:HNH endonuclease [Escherichia coli]MCU6292762.1 HNH endonuclease [Escherichia coli]